MKLCDIMNLKEKQAAAKQTFVFLGSLANEVHDIMSVSEGMIFWKCL